MMVKVTCHQICTYVGAHALNLGHVHSVMGFELVLLYSNLTSAPAF